ncbi:hypothetical protein [Devosia sp. 2618]|uniref:hypothetical protein n=1 Tax=Devosia sp. 2618 TaxID=3156454 RepID=UPI0033950D3C
MKSYIERRSDKRERISVKATVVAEGGVVRHDVLIMNISRSGVMIEMCETAELPAKFILLYSNKIQPCTTVWRDGKFAGVSFFDRVQV